MTNVILDLIDKETTNICKRYFYNVGMTFMATMARFLPGRGALCGNHQRQTTEAKEAAADLKAEEQGNKLCERTDKISEWVYGWNNRSLST